MESLVMTQDNQNELNMANQEFWDELCGTSLAKTLGITSNDNESLKKFDDAYLDFYPYLLSLVKPETMECDKVLEVGLGYGTLGQKIAERAEYYQGLDISFGPLKMMNHRLRLANLRGNTTQGSALNMPFENETFDCVVSIGCYHHTGNTIKSIDETYRVLKPEGRAVIMLYNRFSMRQWLRWPLHTVRALIAETLTDFRPPATSENQRKAYDAGSTGQAAPKTEFFSKKQIQRLFKNFSSVRSQTQNCDAIGLPGVSIVPRKRLLSSFGRWFGLDLYIEAKK